MAAASERRDQGEIGNEQAKDDEDRRSVLVGDPEERDHDDQHDAESRALGDSG
jgi:hypothetical protein